MTREIPLTQGKVALVDDEDYERVSRHRWYAVRGRDTYYGKRRVPSPTGTNRSQFLHQFIAGLIGNYDLIDHKNRNGLDCTRGNLRPATQSDNHMNSKTYASNTSGHRGVVWDKNAGKWKAQITCRGKCHHLGLYVDKDEAISARETAEVSLFGEFRPTEREPR